MARKEIEESKELSNGPRGPRAIIPYKLCPPSDTSYEGNTLKLPDFGLRISATI